MKDYIQEKKEKERAIKKLWSFATQMLYAVPKTSLRSAKGILMEFEEKEEELEEEELLSSIITRISDHYKEEIEKEKKLKILLIKLTPIRKCQTIQETQLQKESLTLSSNKKERFDPSKSQDIILSNREVLEGSLEGICFNYSKGITSSEGDERFITNEEIPSNPNKKIEGKISLPQSIKMDG
ncbi:hypothetical protein O181_119617 [Austropuccinia psidii MF-1]|uniref:Uncharacterized protein n=1 Tax=Austropuccinia psidii MF-1 TaxID=1389203 RepID=A0A9Q3KHL5_9BASI|nr:hypothetical protein [Austropuccinia psidii MF-1]